MNVLADSIRSCEYLYLGALTEPGLNQIKIVLLEAAAGPLIDADTLASEPDPVLRSILAGSREIEQFPNHVAGVGECYHLVEACSAAAKFS